MFNSTQKTIELATLSPQTLGVVCHEQIDRYEIFIAQMPMDSFHFEKINMNVTGIYYE